MKSRRPVVALVAADTRSRDCVGRGMLRSCLVARVALCRRVLWPTCGQSVVLLCASTPLPAEAPEQPGIGFRGGRWPNGEAMLVVPADRGIKGRPQFVVALRDQDRGTRVGVGAAVPSSGIGPPGASVTAVTAAPASDPAADAVVCLASDLAAVVTGQTLHRARGATRRTGAASPRRRSAPGHPRLAPVVVARPGDGRTTAKRPAAGGVTRCGVGCHKRPPQGS